LQTAHALSREAVDGQEVSVSHVLENRGRARELLQGLDVRGEPRRGNHLAADLVGAKGRAFVMRILAVLTILLLTLGFAPLPAAHAETPGKGQALGILVLAGLLKAGSQSGGRAAVEKPKPSMQGAPKVRGRAADLKSGKVTAKDGQGRLDQIARGPH
jgi:hypothetical protein